VSKEGVIMATRHFDKAKLAEPSDRMLFSTKLMYGYAAPLRKMPGLDQQRLPPGVASGQEAVADLHALGRGLRWAFAIEGGAALLFYAAWCLWRLWQ
jgi:hypothetical protein